jgi:biotin synthase
MSLTILPRRVALRSAANSKLWIRRFSTVVDDTFSPVSPSAAPPPPQTRKGRVLEEAVNAKAPRYDWTKDEIREVYNTPLMELAFQAVCWCQKRYC